MEYLNQLISGVCSNGLFLTFFIAVLGYLLGSVNIRGLRLGTSAVFLVALLFGHFGFADASLLHRIGLITASGDSLRATFSLIQNVGLLCFVAAVGLIAGPHFFRDFRQNIKSYVLLAVIVIGFGAGVCVVLVLAGGIDSALAAGLLSGALTTTPGYAAAQEAVAGSELLLREVSVGYAIAYPFGVVGVVLFVQLVPRLLRTNMQRERALLRAEAGESSPPKKAAFRVDPMGMFVFAFAVAAGILLGRISIPLPGGAVFSLGNTGGALLMGLLFGHLRKLGGLDLSVDPHALETLREIGLMLFLIGAGVPGGSGFVEILREQGAILFVYGALMTVIPMVCGYFFASRVLHMQLLNNLGAITGGMTSTPALGTLIRAAGTGDVATAYAAVYPAALVLVVLGVQFIVTLL
ncbi:MAG: permease [Ruminococcaceae bacterium]|nr:permease [Oscillospiraceae bacterium]